VTQPIAALHVIDGHLFGTLRSGGRVEVSASWSLDRSPS
jgi:hypothetical protein